MRLRVVDNDNTHLNLSAPNNNNLTLESDFNLINGIEDVQINDESIVENSIANIIVDSSLSSTSTNPISNSVVNNAINTKQDALTSTQLGAVNSGITAEKVSSYEDKVKVIRSASGALIFFKNTYQGGQ